MANKKMTVVEKFTAIGEMLNGTYEGELTKEQALSFIKERIEQTRKKNASGSGEKKLTLSRLPMRALRRTSLLCLPPLPSLCLWVR